MASTNSDQAIEKRRFLKVISNFSEALEQLNPELVSFSQLEALNNSFKGSEIWGQIIAYKENGEVKFLRTANDNVGNLLSQLPLLLVIAKRSPPEKPIKGLEKLVDDFTASFLSKRIEVDTEVQRLSEDIAIVQNKVKELINAIEGRRQETDTRISEWQKQFSEAQENRISEYNQWRNKMESETRTEIHAQLTNSKLKLENNQIEFNADIVKYLSDAKEKHQAILDLYELTASDSVGAGALKDANDEKMQADKWRRGVIFFIFAAVLWLGITIFMNIGLDENGTVIWVKLLKAASLTGALALGASFCMSQTKQHRNSEKSIKWFSLKIKAIDPYLASLDITQRAETKMKLSEKMFGHSHETSDTNTRIGPKFNMKDFVALISAFRGEK